MVSEEWRVSDGRDIAFVITGSFSGKVPQEFEHLVVLKA